MADEKTPQTKVDKAENAADGAGAEENLISTEDLDKIIQDSDPEFSHNLTQLSSVPASEEQNIDLLDIDTLLKEQPASAFSLKGIWQRFRSLPVQLFTSLKFLFVSGLKEGLPFLISRTRQGLAVAVGFLSAKMSNFKYMSLKKKLAVVGLTLLSVFLVIFTYRSLTVGIIPQGDHLFVNSMEEWARKTYTYQGNEARDDFYNSSRVKQNIMALRRAVVNLKRSANSGPNPMAFFEFFFEGNSADVVVELKDREYEVIDQVQRIIEEYTFNELDVPEGKQMLLEKIRKEVNSFLTKGKIRRVYIKQAIVKP